MIRKQLNQFTDEIVSHKGEILDCNAIVKYLQNAKNEKVIITNKKLEIMGAFEGTYNRCSISYNKSNENYYVFHSHPNHVMPSKMDLKSFKNMGGHSMFIVNKTHITIITQYVQYTSKLNKFNQSIFEYLL